MHVSYSGHGLTVVSPHPPPCFAGCAVQYQRPECPASGGTFIPGKVPRKREGGNRENGWKWGEMGATWGEARENGENMREMETKRGGGGMETSAN